MKLGVWNAKEWSRMYSEQTEKEKRVREEEPEKEGEIGCRVGGEQLG